MMQTLLIGLSLLLPEFHRMDDLAVPANPRPITLEDVAKLPAPGTTVPTAIGFNPEGTAVSYLLPEKPGGTTRVVWRADADGKTPPKVVGRPPGAGETDANVSKEEALRRERQRNREVGVTSLQRAGKVDATVYPIASDLYVQIGEAGLERITHTPEPEIDPQLSPDGTKVAYVRSNELRVLRLSDKRETTLSAGAVEGLTHGLAEFMAQEEMGRFTGFWWSPDGSKIAYQETDERHIPLYTIVHEGANEFSSETHRYPFPGKANAKVSLLVVPADGGESKRLEIAEPGADFYLARVNWLDSSTLLVQTLNREQNRLRLERIDVATGSRKLVVEETSKSWVNLHDDLRVIDKDEILWTSERTGYRHIEILKADGSARRAVTSGEWMVDGVVGLDLKRREVWFTSGKADVVGAKAYRVGLDGGAIVEVTPEPGTHKVTPAKDGDRFVDVHSSARRPPRTTLRDREGKILATLDDSAGDPRLKSFELAPPELVTFASRDGVALHGAFYKPINVKPGAKAPLMVLLYGGPHVQHAPDAWSITADLRAQYFAANGFAVWKMDNRGSARRGLAFESALHRSMGGVEVRDQVDGVKHVGKTWPDLVDATRVGVNGRSYGGYMSLRCLIEAPEVFKAAVAEAPVTDWDGYDTCYTERYMGTPQNNPDGYKSSSVIANAYRLQGKLLIMHGLIDENVHFRHTARLISALIDAGKPFELLTVPEERHSSRKPANRLREVERLTEFFEGALKPPG